ncbi:MAG: imidazole glycerol phosphate synthase subunit HisH [Sphingopyxis sp.]|uniref:imidazole glycerol phosphate synthase subunit HisH n=1 Tax=Sphingopyxis sp. TaxID=1908224 RepID=UPI002ABB6B9D|nr:imidazole glycerol phosphate synthase subunit HisH [Sphingopyxis sp.]MDZ3831675.1 imidazole glycerol phosphate synthase subunit HisH [Sphingopyxis sp.]
MIAIVDYDIGNLGAIENMLARLGAKAAITNDAEKIRSATGLILPGNGSFDACMCGLRATGLLPTIEKRVFDAKVPILGICVGAQMIGKGSEEGNEKGLGWVDMTAHKFPASPALRVPHMGWGSVRVTQRTDPIGSALEPDSRFYFVHSYYLKPAFRHNVILEANYGFDFAAGVVEGNIYGVQFHPEKSHRFGKSLLRAFKDLCG